MKKLVLGVLAAAAFSGSAIAADMAVKAAAPIPVRPACAQFGGFYVGGNVGYAYHDTSFGDPDNWIDNFNNDFNSSHIGRTRDGFVGGVQGGYNWQRGCTVFGVEIDASWADLNKSRSYSPFAGGTTLTISDNLRWFGTARTRAGVIVDDLLIYATGGFAFADIKHQYTVVDPPGGNPTETIVPGSSRYGWTAGLGVEWAINNNWSLKTEALYIKFNEKATGFFSPAGPQNVTVFSNDSLAVTRIGLNYRFGGPAVARY